MGAERTVGARDPATVFDVEASPIQDGLVTLTLSKAEAVTLHELVAFSEWSEELRFVEVRNDAERKVLSRLQLALQPLIPELGKPGYGNVVTAAWTAVRDRTG